MRKRISVVTTLVALAACTRTMAPSAFVSAVSSPTEVTIECAVRSAKSIGYTVKNDNDGSVTVEKKTSNEIKENVFAFLDILTASNSKTPNKTYSKMTIVAFYAPSGETRLRVITWQALGGGDNGTISLKPTARGISDGKEVLKACGKGDVTEEICTAQKRSRSVTGCSLR